MESLALLWLLFLPFGRLFVGRGMGRAWPGMFVDLSVPTNIFVFTFEDDFKHKLIKCLLLEDISMLRHIKLIFFKHIYSFDGVNRDTDQRSFLIILRCLDRAGVGIILIIADALVRHLEPSGHEVTLNARFEPHDFPLTNNIFIIIFFDVNHHLLGTHFPPWRLPGSSWSSFILPIIIQFLIPILWLFFGGNFIGLSGWLDLLVCLYFGLPL